MCLRIDCVRPEFIGVILCKKPQTQSELRSGRTKSTKAGTVSQPLTTLWGLLIFWMSLLISYLGGIVI